MSSKLLLVAALAMLCPAVFAATITVTSLADNTTPDGQVTLREAIQAANTDSSVDGSTAGSGADTIIFSGSLSGTISLSIVGDTTVGSSGLGISSPVTIAGPTTNSITISRTGGNMRLFHVASGASLTLNNLTLTNGAARGGNGANSPLGGTGGGGAGMGGAIFSSGTLTLSSCTLSGNSANGGNGGVGSSGSSRNGGDGGGPNGGTGGTGGTTPGGTGGNATGIGGGGGGGGTGGNGGGSGGNGGFGGGAGGGGGGGSGSGASAGSSGQFGGSGSGGSNGGIGIGAGGFGGGGAGMGGAIFANGGSITLIQCTFSGNSTSGGSGNAGSGSRVGGGLFALNTTTCDIDNCTFSGNTGGAVRLHGHGATANARIRSTILANSSNGNDFHASTSSGGATSSSGTNNVIESSSGFGGSTSSTSDPALGSLQNNGGPTNTHLPSGSSVAINSGSNPLSLTVDQRGDARVFGASIDVGAVEFGATPPTVTTPTSSSVSYTTATLGGNVTADGGATITARGVVFSITTTNNDPLIGGTGVTNQTTTGTTGVFTVGVSSLAPNTQYSFKAYATNSEGTTYTSVATFNTLALPAVTSIVRTGAATTNATSVSWTITLSAAVTNFTTTNIGITVGGLTSPSVTSLVGSGTTWTATADTGSGNGTIRMDVNNDNAVSPGISNVPFTTGEVYTIDKTAPSVSSIVRASGTPTNATSVDFTITFSETVVGVTTGAFSLDTTGVAGAGVTGISGSGATRTVSVSTGTGDGTVSIDLTSFAGIQDGAGNSVASGFTAGEAYNVDKTAPSVSSIVRADADPTAAASVDFTVTFDESVTGVTTGAFALDTTGVSGAAIAGIAGSGTTYTVSVSTGTGDGTVSIDLSTIAGIADAASNALSGTFSAGEAYTVDKSAPGISIGAPSTSTATTGPVDFTITYTGASTVTLAVGDVTLNTTGNATGSVAVSGTGTATRTVTISSITGNGTIGISIAAGTAADAASNQAPAAGPSGTFTVNNAPGISIGAPSVTLTSGGPVDFVITYNAATAVTLVAGDVTINPTGTVAGSVSVSGTGTTTRTVTVNSITGDGTFTISIAANTASNPGGSAPAAGPSSSVDVDNTAPGLTPGTAVLVSQGQTATGATVGTVTDNLTAAGSLGVAATNIPTGLVVTGITNTGGIITADIEALPTATLGTHQVEFTVTDGAGSSSTANLDVDVQANQPPTISAIADVAIPMNTATSALGFTVDDFEDGATPLTLAATADNGILLNAGTDFLFGGSGANRTLTVTPQTNNVGVATITVTVTDSAAVSTNVTFVLTVTDATDAPAIAPTANIVITRDQTSAAFGFTVSDPQGVGTLGAPSADSQNTTLIQAGDFTFGGTAPNLTFTITPQPAQIGSAVCTVFISDGTFTASRSFTVLVQDPTGSSGGGDDDDQGCSTSTGNSWWLLTLALLGLGVIGVRQLRRD